MSLVGCFVTARLQPQYVELYATGTEAPAAVPTAAVCTRKRPAAIEPAAAATAIDADGLFLVSRLQFLSLSLSLSLSVFCKPRPYSLGILSEDFVKTVGLISKLNTGP